MGGDGGGGIWEHLRSILFGGEGGDGGEKKGAGWYGQKQRGWGKLYINFTKKCKGLMGMCPGASGECGGPHKKGAWGAKQ